MGREKGERDGAEGCPLTGLTPWHCPAISCPAPQPSAARVPPFPAPPSPALWRRRVGVRVGADPRSPVRKEGGWEGRQWGGGSAVRRVLISGSQRFRICILNANCRAI